MNSNIFICSNNLSGLAQCKQICFRSDRFGGFLALFVHFGSNITQKRICIVILSLGEVFAVVKLRLIKCLIVAFRFEQSAKQTTVSHYFGKLK